MLTPRKSHKNDCMQERPPASRLVSVASGLTAIAPLLWGSFSAEQVVPLRLVAWLILGGGSSHRPDYGQSLQVHRIEKNALLHERDESELLVKRILADPVETATSEKKRLPLDAVKSCHDGFLVERALDSQMGRVGLLDANLSLGVCYHVLHLEAALILLVLGLEVYG
jgi:hypothetical protein